MYIEQQHTKDLARRLRSTADVSEDLYPLIVAVASFVPQLEESTSVYAWNPNPTTTAALVSHGDRLVHALVADGNPSSRSFRRDQVASIEATGFNEWENFGATVEWQVTQWTIHLADGTAIKPGAARPDQADRMAEFIVTLLQP